MKNSDNGKKSSTFEIQRRVEEIKLHLLDGQSRGTIVREGSKKWKVSERQVDDYLRFAKDQINKEFKPIRNMEMAKHIARRERFLELTMRKRSKDLWLALKIDDSLAKLKGLMIENVLVPFESKKLKIEFEKD